MRVVPVSGRIKGPEGWCPPAPFITVDDAEGRKLINAKIAAPFEGEVVEPAEGGVVSFDLLDVLSESDEFRPWFDAYFDRRLAAIPVVADKPRRGRRAAETPPADTPPADPAPADAERAQHIADALDLIDDEHLEAEGDRAGKPKLAAIAEITGFDVTAEEVEAALALKEVAA
jgi:hypothetical protein